LKVEVRCSDGPDVVGMSPVFSLAHDEQVFTPVFYNRTAVCFVGGVAL
jgi:hypothetical protein